MLNKTYCGNHFTIYINQIIMLHTLNLYSGICQLFLNKTKKKKTTSFSYAFLYTISLALPSWTISIPAHSVIAFLSGSLGT